MDVKNLSSTLACILRINDLYRFLRIKVLGTNIVVLLYHRVWCNENKWSTPGVTILEFEKQIEYLNKNYTIMPLEILLKTIESEEIRKTGNNQIAAITFDDGYKDNYENAFPILKKYQIPATIFLTSGLIGKDELFWWDKMGYYIYHSKFDKVEFENMGEFHLTTEKERLRCINVLGEKLKQLPKDAVSDIMKEIEYKTDVKIPRGLGKEMILSWEEVREMQNWGISIGAHTVTHQVLSKLSNAAAAFEIWEGKEEIEKYLGIPINMFAYPNGGITDYSKETQEIVRNAGYKYALTTNQGFLNRIEMKNPFELKRITIDNGFGKFKLKISGLPADIYELLGIYK